LTGDKKEELQGITLNVYLYAAKKESPVGPRDVMKRVNLSSPSVAYRHLQKLEDTGYLKKNEYGEYIIASKARIRGHVWLGRHLIPKMWLYSLVFLAILIVELAILMVHFSIETYEFKVFFLLLALITSLALTVFTVEGLLQRRRISNLTTE
jgi:DNA-binding transcriptional ArsR family regulator